MAAISRTSFTTSQQESADQGLSGMSSAERVAVIANLKMSAQMAAINLQYREYRAIIEAQHHVVTPAPGFSIKDPVYVTQSVVSRSLPSGFAANPGFLYQDIQKGK